MLRNEAIVSNLASSTKNVATENKFLGDGGDSKKFLLIIATAREVFVEGLIRQLSS